MKLSLLIPILILSLVACQPQAAASPTAAEQQPPAAPDTPAATPFPSLPPPTETPPPEASLPTSTSEPTPTLEPTPASLPADPQEITLTASDGQSLTGRYYPASAPIAPVIVLIHWYRGDMNDWNEIAPWLQNRGLVNPFPNPGNPAEHPWWDPSWFPPLPVGESYAVFTINLRNCQPFSVGCSGADFEPWLLDIQAAMLQATQLPGVDPARVIAIGSSIGADGAADGCAWLNREQPGACKGAISLSPGSYLTLAYADVIKELSEAQPPVPAWCFGANGAEEAFCRAAGEYPSYQAYGFPAGHGNYLLVPGLDPLPMQLIIDFLHLALGE